MSTFCNCYGRTNLFPKFINDITLHYRDQQVHKETQVNKVQEESPAPRERRDLRVPPVTMEHPEE